MASIDCHIEDLDILIDSEDEKMLNVEVDEDTSARAGVKVTVNLPENLMEATKKIAKAYGITVTEIIRTGLEKRVCELAATKAFIEETKKW